MQGSRGYQWSSRQRRSWGAREAGAAQAHAWCGSRVPPPKPYFLTPLTCSLTTMFPRKSSWPLSFRASLKILFQAGAMRGVGQDTEVSGGDLCPSCGPLGLDTACSPATDMHTRGGQKEPTLLPPGTSSRAFTFAAHADL